jgi:hypothetical protein
MATTLHGSIFLESVTESGMVELQELLAPTRIRWQDVFLEEVLRLMPVFGGK